MAAALGRHDVERFCKAKRAFRECAGAVRTCDGACFLAAPGGASSVSYACHTNQRQRIT